MGGDISFGGGVFEKSPTVGFERERGFEKTSLVFLTNINILWIMIYFRRWYTSISISISVATDF